MDEANQIILRVERESHADLEGLADLTWRLRDELSDLDVSVEHARAGSPPDHAKGEALAWTELIVAFSGALPGLVAMVRSWTARNTECSVTIELDGDKLSLSGASRTDQQRLINAWLSRHHSQ